MYSFFGSAQFYVQKNTLFSLKSTETILSSKEAVNQIDSAVLGEGSLYLNASASQDLRSTEQVLELPNLQLKNASLIHLDTALAIDQQLVVENGLLTLSQTLFLHPPDALVLLANAHIHASATAQILYTMQLTGSNPLVWNRPLMNLIKYTPPKRALQRPIVVLIPTHMPNIEQHASNDYTAYDETITPPPKIAHTSA